MTLPKLFPSHDIFARGFVRISICEFFYVRRDAGCLLACFCVLRGKEGAFNGIACVVFVRLRMVGYLFFVFLLGSALPSYI